MCTNIKTVVAYKGTSLATCKNRGTRLNCAYADHSAACTPAPLRIMREADSPSSILGI